MFFGAGAGLTGLLEYKVPCRPPGAPLPDSGGQRRRASRKLSGHLCPGSPISARVLPRRHRSTPRRERHLGRSAGDSSVISALFKCNVSALYIYVASFYICLLEALICTCLCWISVICLPFFCGICFSLAPPGSPGSRKDEEASPQCFLLSAASALRGSLAVHPRVRPTGWAGPH